ncbi:MAG: dihydroxy-acid dehydratase, partial [Caulobacter sp. 35-67-4]
MGYSSAMLEKPVVGIAYTGSGFNNCHRHFPELLEAVKRGVLAAGALPVEFPTISLGEVFLNPTSLKFRNLMSIDTEEMVRAQPMDSVVLMGGCDKTTPGQMMGAASVDLPTIVISSGPMLNGKFRGKDIGSGTDVWKFSEAVRAGEMTLPEFMSAESGMSRSPGTCMTMGTASTMASIVEAMGMSLPYNATIPAVDARRKAMSHETGRAIVRMVQDGRTMSQVVTRASFENALRVHAAIGGSTNAVVHLLALAGRLGIELTLEDFDVLSRDVPLLVDLQPSGRFLMEDLHYAGGVPAVMKALEPFLDPTALTVTGAPIGAQYEQAEVWNAEVIRPLDNPVKPDSGIWVLRGNLAPGGAVMKPSAASPELCSHTGKAVVFETIEDFRARIDDPDLDVDETSILVLKGCGPKGYPGMPEV